MSRVRYRDVDVDALGRIMRAEAQGEGLFGMKLVGNVVVNRAVTTCGDFKKVKTIYNVIFQKGQFEGTKIPLFYAKATSKERKLALDCIKFWRAYPAYRAVYFQYPGRNKPCKKRFWGPFAGRFKNHCFYNLDSTKRCNL